MPDFRGKSIWLMLILMACINNLHAQKESYNWYFGNNAGISFKKSPPSVLLDGKLTTREGCATISDEKGNLLFYTDGLTVYNRNHKPMLNGSGLTGNSSSTQSAVIVKKPGNADVFYVFTTDAFEGGVFGFRYSLVDMQLDGGMGDVIPQEKNILLVQSYSEKIAAIKHSNCKDVWIITYDGGGLNKFFVFLLTDKGLSPSPLSFSTGKTHGVNRGYMKCSPDGTKIAAVIDEGEVGLYKFDKTTGNISFSNSFVINTNNGFNIYGVEFSPDGSLLYSASRYYGSLYQHNLSKLNTTKLADSIYLGCLQNAPDGKLYIAQVNTNYLGIIEKPNLEGTACSFKKDAIYLGGKGCNEGLPNFLVNCYKPSFFVSYKDTCFGNSTLFSVYSSHSPATFKWKFNDSNATSDTSSLQNPSHLFSQPGNFEVTLIASAENVTDTIRLMINIKYPFEPFSYKQIRTCVDSYIGLTTGNPDASHLWENGQKAQTFWTKDPGFYKVILMKDGCTFTDSIEVVLIDTVKLDLGNDLALCMGEMANLDAGTSADNYLWSTNDTTQQISVNAEGKYWVKKTKEGCSISDTIFVSIKDSVILDLGNNLNFCANETIILDAGGDADFYLWSTTETTQKIAIKQPGIYWAKKTKGSCSASDTIRAFLKDTVILNLGNDFTYCAGETATLDAGANADSYFWSTSENTQKININKAGTYWIKRIKEGCVSTDTVSLSFYSKPFNQIVDTSLCENEEEIITLSAGEGTNFSWQPFGETDKTIRAAKPAKYSVTYNDINGCLQNKLFNVENHCKNSLYIPNIFKPNSPFYSNNLFRAIGSNILNFQIKIYNRWGELIFTSDNLEEGWNGSYNGKECAEGVYLYLIQYTASTGKAMEKNFMSGTFTLLW